MMGAVFVYEKASRSEKLSIEKTTVTLVEKLEKIENRQIALEKEIYHLRESNREREARLNLLESSIDAQITLLRDLFQKEGR